MTLFLDMYGNHLLSMCQPEVQDKDTLMQLLIGAKGSENEIYSAACLAILVVPLLLNEDRSVNLGSKNPEPAPIVQ